MPPCSVTNYPQNDVDVKTEIATVPRAPPPKISCTLQYHKGQHNDVAEADRIQRDIQYLL